MDGWTGVAAVPNSVYNTCTGAPAGSFSAAMYGTRAPGVTSYQRFSAPADTTIGRMVFNRVVLRNVGADDTSQRFVAGWIGVDGPGYDKAVDACGLGCDGLGYSPKANPNPVFDTGTMSAHDVYVAAGCVSTGAACNPNGENTGGAVTVEVKSVDTELVDASAPTAAGLTGPLSATGSHKGTETATFTANDKGAGLRYTVLQIKPKNAADWQTPTQQPVSSNNGTLRRRRPGQRDRERVPRRRAVQAQPRPAASRWTPPSTPTATTSCGCRASTPPATPATSSPRGRS